MLTGLVLAAVSLAALPHCSDGNLDGQSVDGGLDAPSGPALSGDPFVPGSACQCSEVPTVDRDQREYACTCPAECSANSACAIHCAGPECGASNPVLSGCGRTECDTVGDSLSCSFEECPRPTGEEPCDGTVELLEDQVQVIMSRRTFDTGTLRVSASGWYDLFNTVLAESGPSQRNESAYFRVPQPTNATNPEGYPRVGNCGRDFVVVDSDNNATPTEAKFIGTFWLEAGDNLLEMYHYCPLFSEGTCTEFHIDDDPGNVCGDSPDSVHFKAEGTQAVCVERLI